MALISQTKAAKLAGVSRGTIANRISEGKLSQGPDGIDVAELVRVFPEITTERIEAFLAGEAEPEPDKRGEKTGQVADDRLTLALEARLAAVEADKQWLQQLLDKRERQIEEKDRLLSEQAGQISALLPAPGEATPLEKAHHEIGRLTALLESKRKRFLGIF